MSNPTEDLAFLRDVVERSRRALAVDVAPIVVWGLLGIVGVVGVKLVPWLDSVVFWAVLIGLAWLYVGYRLWSRPDEGAALFAHRALYRTWAAVLGAMTLIGFAGSASGMIAPSAVVALEAVLFGVALLVTGVLLDSRRASALGLLWWAVALALMLMPPAWRLPLFGLALGLLIVLPALVFARAGAASSFE